MSTSQLKIIHRLLAAATNSTQNKKLAAAVCAGKKILSLNINTDRNKYGDQILCSGHAETAALYKLFPSAFKRKKKGSCVQ